MKFLLIRVVVTCCARFRRFSTWRSYARWRVSLGKSEEALVHQRRRFPAIFYFTWTRFSSHAPRKNKRSGKYRREKRYFLDICLVSLFFVQFTFSTMAELEANSPARPAGAVGFLPVGKTYQFLLVVRITQPELHERQKKSEQYSHGWARAKTLLEVHSFQHAFFKFYFYLVSLFCCFCFFWEGARQCAIDRLTSSFSCFSKGKKGD